MFLVCKGYKRGTARSFLHSFPLSGARSSSHIGHGSNSIHFGPFLPVSVQFGSGRLLASLRVLGGVGEKGLCKGKKKYHCPTLIFFSLVFR